MRKKINILMSEGKYFHVRVTANLVTTTAFVPKDVAIIMNLLLHRIINEQMDM